MFQSRFEGIIPLRVIIPRVTSSWITRGAANTVEIQTAVVDSVAELACIAYTELYLTGKALIVREDTVWKESETITFDSL